MKIKKVSFSEEEENQIFDALIERFDLTKSDIWTKYGQTVIFDLNELIEVEAKIELYNEGSTDENNQGSTISQSVVKFKITFFSKEGDEVQAEMISTCGKCLDDRISNHYRI